MQKHKPTSVNMESYNLWEDKAKKRDSGSDCHCRKLDIGQKEKMKTN